MSHGSSTVPRYIVDEINALGGNIQNAYGISKEELKAAIPCGIGKINVDTDIRLAVTRNFRELFRDHPELKEDAKVGASGSCWTRSGTPLTPGPSWPHHGHRHVRHRRRGGRGSHYRRHAPWREGGRGHLIVEFGSYGKAPLVEPATLEDMAARYAKEG